jgi:hypothetical protein
MIGASLEAARTLSDAAGAGADFTPLAPDAQVICRDLMGTIQDLDFPGAIVPNVAADGALRVYVVAQDLPQWRKLVPVLRAFAGLTLTSFEGRPQPLPANDPGAQILMGCAPAVTAIMRVPPDAQLRLVVLRALARARETLARAPVLQRNPPEPTSWLLARFQDYLNTTNRAGAAGVLARLGDELRLDSLNLQFLRAQLHAAFGEWREIVEAPSFAHLCHVRRTPAVTAILLEALYHHHIGEGFDTRDRAGTRDSYSSAVRPLARPLLAASVVPTLREGALRLYGLEALLGALDGSTVAALLQREEELGWIAQDPSWPKAARPAPAPADGLEAAQAAILKAGDKDSLAGWVESNAVLSQLDPAAQAQVRAAEPFKSLLEEVAPSLPDAPLSWGQWFARIVDPTFTAAFEVARRGKDEWSIGNSECDPEAARALEAALHRALNDPLAAERIAEALPFIVGWLNRDDAFPRPSLQGFYATLLTLFSLNAGRGRSTYESSQVLISGLLSIGLDGNAYRALIADVEELAGDGFGVGMVYWLLEIVEEFMQAATPDDDARGQFLHRVMSKLAPLYARLSVLQRASIARLAGELGWTLDEFGINSTVIGDDALAGRLADLRIAIYSLTEAASTQAKEAIEQASPTAKVDCNADHAGTPRLRALAENVDLFVLVWRSAKHAATDFIRAHRGAKPLLFAQGKGSSSILRAIEDHFAHA